MYRGIRSGMDSMGRILRETRTRATDEETVAPPRRKWNSFRELSEALKQGWRPLESGHEAPPHMLQTEPEPSSPFGRTAGRLFGRAGHAPAEPLDNVSPFRRLVQRLSSEADAEENPPAVSQTAGIENSNIPLRSANLSELIQYDREYRNRLNQRFHGEPSLGFPFDQNIVLASAESKSPSTEDSTNEKGGSYVPLPDSENYLKIEDTVVPESNSSNRTDSAKLRLDALACEMKGVYDQIGFDKDKWKVIYKNSRNALKVANRVAKLRNFTPGEKNAFRHALWSCSLGRDLGDSHLAFNVMMEHEKCDKSELEGYGTKDSDIDILNNRFGLGLGENNPDRSCSDLSNKAITDERRKKKKSQK